MLPQEEPLPEPLRQPKQHPFFDLNSSESSSSEESKEEEEEQKQPAGLPPQLGKSKTKKPRIPSAIKRRVDRYIEAKMREVGGSSRGVSNVMYSGDVALAPRYFQYL